MSIASSESQMDLGELFNHYGSDKDRNGYTPVYHTLFNHLRDKELDMLEIGIGTMIPSAHSSMANYSLKGYKPGGSLRAWRDYFPKAKITGADVQPDTQFTDEERITTCICNSTDAEAVSKKFSDQKFDIIIDDGSHSEGDQLKTAINFYPHVKDGGYYIIEDIGQSTLLNTSPYILEVTCKGDPFFFVGLKSNICVIYKNNLKRSQPRDYY